MNSSHDQRHPQRLLKAHDELSSSIGVLERLRDGLIRRAIVDALPALRADCGLVAATPEIKDAFEVLQNRLSPPEVLDLLFQLRERRATVTDFVSIWQVNRGLDVKDVLSVIGNGGCAANGLCVGSASNPLQPTIRRSKATKSTS